MKVLIQWRPDLSIEDAVLAGAEWKSLVIVVVDCKVLMVKFQTCSYLRKTFGYNDIT